MVAGEGPLIVVVGDDVLPELGPDRFEGVAQVPDDREVAQDRVLALDQVVEGNGPQNPNDDEQEDDQESVPIS